VLMGRTNIVLDDDLIAQAVRLTGAKSKREAVDIALRQLLDQRLLFEALRKIRGKLEWRGHLSRWRKSRV
jgi:Arc/MetJ family transcription regulator